MKKIITFVLTFLFFNSGQAQTSKIKDIIDTLTLTEEQFFKIIKKEFNSVINSSGKTTIGNYASTDIKDGHVAFNSTKNFSKGNMLSLNVNGGITDGFFAIFDQSKINSNVNANVKYNVRLNASSISYDESQILKLRAKISTANNKIEINKSIFLDDSVLLNRKINLLKAETKFLNSQLDSVKLTDIQKAEIEYQIAVKNLEQDSLNLKLLTTISSFDALKDFKNTSAKEKENAEANFEYSNIIFKWISFGAGFQNNNFNQFKSNFLTLDSQIIAQNFLAWNASFEYNVYKWNKYCKPTLYFLIGIKGIIDDNFSSLSKIEINDTHNYGDSTNQRTVVKKFNAYKGDYKTKLNSAKLYFDFYRFFFKNIAAIHIYPEANFKQYETPIYNTGIGLLYSFKDLKDKENKAKLNAELYFNLSDLTNNANSKLSILKRNELGLRLSIPVSFFNF